jgi:hypothetical protein
MRQALRVHPDSLGSAVSGIDVEVMRPTVGSLVLNYLVSGRIGDLRIPAAAASARTDELWRHTCFEAFIRTSPGAAYFEFNFAPSTQWAAYRLDSYRNGMRAAEIAAPRIEVQPSPVCYRLQASLDLARVPTGEPWRIGLAAIIEEVNGHQSHWALAHPPGKADFHHPDGFALELS